MPVFYVIQHKSNCCEVDISGENVYKIDLIVNKLFLVFAGYVPLLLSSIYLTVTVKYR